MTKSPESVVTRDKRKLKSHLLDPVKVIIKTIGKKIKYKYETKKHLSDYQNWGICSPGYQRLRKVRHTKRERLIREDIKCRKEVGGRGRRLTKADCLVCSITPGNRHCGYAKRHHKKQTKTLKIKLPNVLKTNSNSFRFIEHVISQCLS